MSNIIDLRLKKEQLYDVIEEKEIREFSFLINFY